MHKKITAILILTLWAAMTALAWFSPAKEMSDAERRPLAQFPEISAEAITNGTFMTDFTDYSLDQFPLRDSFRRVKSLFHSYVLRQKDNNGIYIAQGSAVKQEYPLKDASVAHALNRFRYLYEQYLTDANVYMAIVPDKGYYLAESAGQLVMDYEAMIDAFREGMPWASHVDLTATLDAQDYYRTDTHWRQESLLETAQALCEALGVPSPKAEDYTVTALERPFYGVYYGQAALPMEADTIRILESDLLKACMVYDFESGKTGAVYDMGKLDSKDMYEVYLSGPRSLLTVENPKADTDRELILFRDSFGSSIAPLLMQGYAKITLVDVRYIQPELLSRLVDCAGKDVLFLYSTLVLNNSATIK